LTQLCDWYLPIILKCFCNIYFLGIDERVKVNKRKLGDLEFDEKRTKKKQKKGNVDKSKNKDIRREKKSRQGCKVYKNVLPSYSVFILFSNFVINIFLYVYSDLAFI